jgi:hypothetical protein
MKKVSLIFIAIFLIGFVIAISTPQGFNGNIVVKDGKSAEGKTLIGYIDGVATGQAIIKNGKFDIVVTDNIGDGGKVEFYIGSEKAKETFTFKTFEITKTNLTFNTVPSQPSSCGDKICSEDECSFCAVDCVISSCSSNGRCDIEIGENCANAPNDCGVCPYCGDGVCNNGETCSTCSGDCGSCSGGDNPGGGGPGGGNPTHPKNTSLKQNLSANNSNANEELSVLSIDKLNDNSNKTGSGITGAVIGFVNSGGGILILVFASLILIVGALIVLRKPGKDLPTKN